jgi:hypothetical protein
MIFSFILTILCFLFCDGNFFFQFLDHSYSHIHLFIIHPFAHQSFIYHSTQDPRGYKNAFHSTTIKSTETAAASSSQATFASEPGTTIVSESFKLHHDVSEPFKLHHGAPSNSNTSSAAGLKQKQTHSTFNSGSTGGSSLDSTAVDSAASSTRSVFILKMFSTNFQCFDAGCVDLWLISFPFQFGFDVHQHSHFMFTSTDFSIIVSYPCHIYHFRFPSCLIRQCCFCLNVMSFLINHWLAQQLS